MAGIEERLDKMEAKIRESKFRDTTGKANEVNYWVFDYAPEHELIVRDRIDYLKNRNSRGTDGFELVVYDLYDLLIAHLQDKNFMEKCYQMEEKRGIVKVASAIQRSLKITDKDNMIVEYIAEHTPDNSVVFLTGVGKCYPLLQSPEVFNKILYNMPQHFAKVPMVLFYPGIYTEQELIIFNGVHEDNIMMNSFIGYGKKLLFGMVQIQTPTEFFQTVAKKQDNLLDFAEDCEPVKAFFNSEQKTIFDKAVLYLSKYDDSETYIVDENLENIVSQISEIVKKQSPYSDIPKLPELLKKFSDVYSDILDEQLKPVLDSVYDSQKRVFDVLNTKEYAETKRSRYSTMFDEIIDAAKGCTNVSVLRSYADRAEALKIRLLNEITQMDRDIALKKAEEVRKRLEEQAKAVGDVDQAQIEAEVQRKVEKVKKTKNISIKSMTKTASWRLETTEDVDKYLNELRLKLVSELDTDTIVNVEF